MRVNIYSEEMTNRIQIIEKRTDDGVFTGLRFYLELPATVQMKNLTDGSDVGAPMQIRGPFMHHPGDDDSAAVTFWGKQGLREVLVKALAELDAHYARLEKARADAEPVCLPADEERSR